MNQLEKAFELFDQYNRQSPGRIEETETAYPVEYFYALKLHDWVRILEPAAGEALLLASRCQHIGRWEIPRSSYPEGREGYLRWRKALAEHHANTSADLLKLVGYDHEIIDRVKEIVLKKKLKLDPEVQTMENALCLVFLQYQYDDLITRYPDDKIISILQKTWKKMSEPGRKAALDLHYSKKGHELITQALSEV